MLKHAVLTGDVCAVLKNFRACSFDGCLCDPPYHLTQVSRLGSPRMNDPATPFGRHKIGARGFMGKTWDGGDTAMRPETWREVWRVLKPGAALLCFGGTRTHHRLMCALEDAGFEIRDTLMWLHGQGFPKSLDISKAIDRRRATNDVIRPWLKSLGSREEIAHAAQVTPRQVDHWLGENKTPCPQTLTEKRFVFLCKYFGTVPLWAGEMFAEVGRKLGTVTHARSGGDDFAKRPGVQAHPRHVTVTSPATAAAQLWDGYGTALKPAWEPIILAMKPCDGTFAANALKHGVAGINVDGSRIHTAGSQSRKYLVKRTAPGATVNKTGKWKQEVPFAGETKDGRWPANVILDEEAAVMLDEQSVAHGIHGAGLKRDNFCETGERSWFTQRGGGTVNGMRFGDSGGASRFFYCAKASRKERGEGNTHPTVKPLKLTEYLARLILPPKRRGKRVLLNPFAGSGSEALGALRAGWDQVCSIEREKEYVKIAERRSRAAAA